MISIITPCFNSSKHISKLLDSLQNQTDNDFELLLIDDCSSIQDFQYLTDLVKSLTINFSLIRNQKNLGAGLSRNVGIESAKGDYLCFIDSDDYVSDDFIEILSEQIKDNRIDIVFFDYIILKKGKLLSCSTLNNLKLEDINQKDKVISFCNTSVCGKLYRKALIKCNGIVFPEIKRFEDWVFNCKCILSANRYLCINNKLYYYVMNNESITHVYKRNVNNYSLKAFLLLEEDFINISKSLAEALFVREVLYVAAIDYIYESTWANKMNISKLSKRYVINFRNKYVKDFVPHHLFILFLLKYKLFVVLKIIGILIKLFR